MTGLYEIEAGCLAEAIDIANKKAGLPLAKNNDYLMNSFRVDEEATFELNPLDDDFEMLGDALDTIIMDDE
jgi:hypothetical protein